MEDSDEISKSIKIYFTSEEWKNLSSYEKLRYFNVKKNHDMLVSLGFDSTPPKFMQQKIKASPEKNASDKEVTETENVTDKKLKSIDDKPVEKVVTSNKKTDVILNAKSTPPSVKFNRKLNRIEATLDGVSPKKDFTFKNHKFFIKADKGVKRVPRRYPKRNISEKCYREEDIPSDDEFLYCEDCGKEYEGTCPVHGPMTLIVNKKVPKDGSVEQRALKTLPSFLSVCPSGIRKAGLGVWTETALPPRLVFGPYEGRIVKKHKEAHKTGYSWQVWKGGRAHHFVEASEDRVSNWLRFVNCADEELRQNLVAFQFRKKIFYSTYKPVPAHCELLVWYGGEYARHLGIDLAPGPANPFPDVECHECDRCGQLYSDADTLQRHRRYHPDFRDEHRFRCHVCDYSTDISSNFQRHLRTHTGERPFACHQCDRTFSEKSSLQKHLKLHSGSESHQCSLCTRVFSRADNLRTHERAVHRKERLFVCGYCGRGFLQSGHRQRHERTHKGLRPHSCPHCRRKFTQASNLKRHVATIHTRQFPHTCSVCGKGFHAPKLLKVHSLKSHPEEQSATLKSSPCDRTPDN